MTYAVYFKWPDDGFEDSFNCCGLKDLKLNIKDLKTRGFEGIEISKISKYGEHVPYEKLVI